MPSTLYLPPSETHRGRVRVHPDFGTFDGVDYLIITDKLTGFLSVTRTRDKSTEQAVLA